MGLLTCSLRMAALTKLAVENFYSTESVWVIDLLWAMFGVPINMPRTRRIIDMLQSELLAGAKHHLFLGVLEAELR